MYQTLDAHLLKIPGTVPVLAPLVAKNGLKGINCPEEILINPELAGPALDAVKANGLKWGLLPTPADMFENTLDGQAFEDALQTLEKWAALGEKLGVQYCYNHIWPSSDLRPFEANFEWHVNRLKRIQPILANHGIKYGFEFLGPHELRVKGRYPFVHTISGVLAIADAAGGQTGFLFDTYHWYTGSGRPDDLYFAVQNCGRMVNFHLNDGVSWREREEQRDMERDLPMTNAIINSRMIYHLFEEAGYSGPVMCEPMSPNTDRYGKIPAEDSIKEIRAAFDRVQA
jgi:sugar phosphate isomerase/epimerase